MPHAVFKGKKFRILQTQAVQLPEGATSLTIEVEDLDVTLSFLKSEDGQVAVDSTHVNRSITFNLYNFNNDSGTSFDGGIGDIGGLALHIVVSVRAIGSGDEPPRTVTVTFLLEAEV